MRVLVHPACELVTRVDHGNYLTLYPVLGPIERVTDLGKLDIADDQHVDVARWLGRPLGDRAKDAGELDSVR